MNCSLMSSTTVTNRATVYELHNIIVCFYLAADISEAKKKLIDNFVLELTDCPFKVTRYQSSNCTMQDAEAEDIIRIFELLARDSMYV